MVDIHSHIVFGVDDGAKTVEDSLAMLNIAIDSGTTDIVATPHSDFRFKYDRELIDERIGRLQEMVGERIRIHRGCDFHLHLDNIRACLNDPSRFTINGKRYLMVEFPSTSISASIPKIFNDLLQRGIAPVITHPERNEILIKNIDTLADWVTDGCLIQVTAQSFSGRFGKQASASARTLIRRNLVHFVASDGHDVNSRPPDMREAYEIVQREFGAHRAEQLFQTYPAMTLAGQYIRCEEPVRRTSRWSFF